MNKTNMFNFVIPVSHSVFFSKVSELLDKDSVCAVWRVDDLSCNHVLFSHNSELPLIECAGNPFIR